MATTSFPLNHPEDIFLAKLVVSGVVTVAVLTAMQNSLKDVDRRVDLYVGELGGDTADWSNFSPHFTSLYEAVEYANEMMNPSSGGRAYQNVRIRVVGRTHEPTARLPIVIKTDGLIIEGNPFYNENPAVAVTSEISWGASPNVSSLIDINGHSDLVFRNLSFRSNGTVYNALCTASVFVCNAGSPSKVTIDNCRSVGFIKYFVNMNGVSGSGRSVSFFQITNNVVGNMIGSAFALVANPPAANQPMTPIQGLTIRGNFFLADTAARTSVGIQITRASTPWLTFMDTLQINDNILIQGNTFEDFTQVIWASTQSGEISNNLVFRSIYEAFLTAGGWLIQNNHLIGVHHDNPNGIFTPYRTGILHYTQYRAAGGLFDTAIFPGKILHNRVEFDNTNIDIANDKAIYVLGSPNTNSDTPIFSGNAAAPAGADNTVTLGAGASAINDFYLGCYVKITNALPAGVVMGEARRITGYNGVTKIAQLDAFWTTAPIVPNATTTIRIDRLYQGSEEIVDGNFAGYTSGDTSILTMSNIRVHAKNAKVDKNTCHILEVWGTDCNITGNTVSYLGVDYDVTATVPNPERAYNDTNVVIGNQVLSLFHPWAGTRAVGNHFVNNVDFLDGNRCIISDNTFDGSLTIGATISSNSFTVSGNRIGTGGLVLGAGAFPVAKATITGNQVTDTGIVAYSNTSNYTGNNLESPGGTWLDFTLVGASNVVYGNITAALSSTGIYNMLTGNQLHDDLTVVTVSGFTVVSQNSVGGDILIQSDDIMLTGNVCDNITFANSLSRMVLTGNMVRTNITLGANGATQTASVVLSGNWVGNDVLPNATQAGTIIAMGNVVVGGNILGQTTTAGNVLNVADNATV